MLVAKLYGIDDPGQIHLTIPSKPRGYADAQIDDTQGFSRGQFKWEPPVRMMVHARAIPGTPDGTFGFGFWNDPFALSLGMKGAARRLPVPPQVIWFFYASPPNDIQLTRDGSGSGWKAMSLRSPHLPGFLTLPPALFALGLVQLRLFRRILMRTAQNMIRVSEAQLPHPVSDWHTYEIAWEDSLARFCVDDVEVMVADHPPTGPLGFVAWIDNQYAIASPEGGFRFGVIPTGTDQRLELKELQVNAL
jgi:hypothetical protein